MGRIANLKDTPAALSGSSLLKTGQGYLFSVTIAWKGATAGQEVYFRDGTDATGAILVPIILNAATGTLQLNWPNGKLFTTGLFYEEDKSANVLTECSYT